MPQEALVTQVKEMQRGDPHAKEQWAAYTDSFGQGRRDPARHSAEFLSSFITHLQSGGQAPVSDESAHLVTTIKFMQKNSDGFKAAWAQFCKDFGGGRFDPSKHDAAFLIKFFDFVASGQQACAPMSMGSMAVAKVMSGIQGKGAGHFDGWGSGNGKRDGWTPSWVAGGQGGAPPAKKARFDAVTPPSQGAGGQQTWGSGAVAEPGTKEYLVVQVKSYQRMGEVAKEQWSSYADTYLGGIKDPARHDAGTLQEFVNTYGVPVPPEQQQQHASGQPQQQQQQQQQGPMDPAKESMVQRIKVFQKASKDHSEMWRQFCGPTCDPARHTEERLHEFLTMYSVP